MGDNVPEVRYVRSSLRGAQGLSRYFKNFVPDQAPAHPRSAYSARIDLAGSASMGVVELALAGLHFLVFGYSFIVAQIYWYLTCSVSTKCMWSTHERSELYCR